jgi:ATP-dependent Lon protease
LDKSIGHGDAEYDPVTEAEELEKILGLSRHDCEDRDQEAKPGVVWGLVVTGMGEGELMPIESMANLEMVQVCAIVSLLTGKCVPPAIAMSGEVAEIIIPPFPPTLTLI